MPPRKEIPPPGRETAVTRSFEWVTIPLYWGSSWSLIGPAGLGPPLHGRDPDGRVGQVWAGRLDSFRRRVGQQ